MAGREMYVYIVKNTLGEEICLTNYATAIAEMQRHGIAGTPTRHQMHGRVGDAKFSRGVPISKAAKGTHLAA